MKRLSTLTALASTDLAASFLIQVMVLASVGVGQLTDAYFAGQAPVLVLLAIVQLPIQRAVLSAFTDLPPGFRFPGLQLYCAIVGVLLIGVGVLLLIGKAALPFAYPTLSSEALDLALRVMGIQGLAVAIAAGNTVLLSGNHIAGRFVRAEVALASASLVTVAWVAITLPSLGVIAAATGQVLKAALAGASYGIMLRGQMTWRRPPWRSLWKIVRPLASAGLLSKLAPLVDRSIASMAASGSITLLVFAQSLYSAAVGVFDRAIVAPRLPSLKREPTWETISGMSVRLVVAGVGVVAALVAGLWFAALLGWASSALPADSVDLLLGLMSLLVGLPVGTLVAPWLAASLVFLGRASVSARIMAWCFLISIPLKVAAFRLGGVHGLAFAMSCYYLGSAASLWFFSRRFARGVRM